MGVTNLSALTVSGTVQGSGAVTATATGKLSQFKKATVHGTLIASAGKFDIKNATNFVIATAENASAGKRKITTGGSSVVVNSKIATTSRIFLTPFAQTANYKGVSARILRQAAGSVAIKLERVQTTGTVANANGTVQFLIVNA